MKEYWTVKDKKNNTRVADRESPPYETFAAEAEYWARFTSRVSALEAQLMHQKHWPTSKSFVVVHHTVKTVPVAKRVGSWAWASERLIDGQTVKMRSSSGRFRLVDSDFTRLAEPGVAGESHFLTRSMMMATDWEVVP